MMVNYFIGIYDNESVKKGFDWLKWAVDVANKRADNDLTCEATKITHGEEMSPTLRRVGDAENVTQKLGLTKMNLTTHNDVDDIERTVRDKRHNQLCVLKTVHRDQFSKRNVITRTEILFEREYLDYEFKRKYDDDQERYMISIIQGDHLGVHDLPKHALFGVSFDSHGSGSNFALHHDGEYHLYGKIKDDLANAMEPFNVARRLARVERTKSVI